MGRSRCLGFTVGRRGVGGSWCSNNRRFQTGSWRHIGHSRHLDVAAGSQLYRLAG